jgi:ATP-binding cassette subfamily B protein
MTRTSSFTDKMGLDRNVIIVAHRPSTILFADNVVVLEQGKVVAVGTNSDLIRQSRAYRELLGGYRFYEQAKGL